MTNVTATLKTNIDPRIEALVKRAVAAFEEAEIGHVADVIRTRLVRSKRFVSCDRAKNEHAIELNVTLSPYAELILLSAIDIARGKFDSAEKEKRITLLLNVGGF